ncbi:MAG: PAS domain S-box protein [SAR324 cluster bacterium]|nr:PAS domain S-box protein [SAR324 cluster bacterium]
MKATSDKMMRYYTGLLILLWLGMTLGLMLWNIYQSQTQIKQMAMDGARTHFTKDQAFRAWANKHGGVYVPPTEKTPPNPWLEFLPERDVVTTGGKELTLMNPAYMLREMMRDFGALYGVPGRIVSDRPLNPDNFPDEWEQQALREFQQGKQEKIEFTEIDGKPYLRMMGAMITTAGCLKCHEHQGYQVGDVRGGVGLSLPMAPYLKIERDIKQTAVVSHLLIGLLGALAIWWSGQKVGRLIRERRRTEEHFQTIVDNAPNAIFMKDLQGHFILVNRKFAEQFHRDVPDIIGKSDFDLLPHDVARKLEERDRLVQQEQRPCSTEEQVSHKDGLHTYLTYKFPMYDESGKLYAVCGVATDLTELKTLEKRILNEQERLKEAQQIAQIGHWELDLRTGSLYWSDQIYRIFGLEPQSFGATYEAFLENIHPEDREMVNEAYANSLAKQEPYEIVHRLLLKDGTLKYVRERCTTTYEDKGQPLHSLGTVQDVTDMVEMEQKLKRAQENAEQANRAKSVFLANMSHEIRNPLNSIVGLSHVLVRDSKDPANLPLMEEYVNYIHAGAKHLVELINNILDLAKIEAGKVELVRERVDLKTLIEGIIQIHKSQVLEKNISLSPDLDHSLPATMFLDRTKINQILMNLVSNAVKFTPVGKKITVKARVVYSELVMAVVDEGIGIANDRQERLFNAFEQADLSIERRYGGTGLGLSLVKQLVELMRGRIELQSEIGKGSCFTVRIPVESLEVNPSEAQKQDWSAIHINPASRVLVAEDEPMNQRMYEILLNKWGVRPVFTGDGEQTVAAVKQMVQENQLPHLILMDMFMPVMNGLDATRIIRQMPGCENLPIVGVSADAMREQMAEAIDAGVNTYLTKPLNVNEFIKVLGDYLKETS